MDCECKAYLVLEDCGTFIAIGWDDEEEAFWEIDKDDLPTVIAELAKFVRTN